MQNKWGLVAASTSVGFAVVSMIANILDLKFLAISFTALTLVSAVAVIANFNRSQKISIVPNVTPTLSEKPSTMHKDSIANAAEQNRASDIDGKANKESAATINPNIEDSHHDEESGLLSKSFFPVYLEQRISAARRTLRPVSLVIFELDGLDKNDSGSPSDRDFFVSAVGDVVKRTLRESDCAFRVDHNIFAAVMDDTAESGAVWAAERVRGVLHTGALAGRVTVSAGVACYPSHCLESKELIESATKALGAAKARGVDQVEIAAEQ